MIATTPPSLYAFDVDGVVICGRPQGGQHWAAQIEADLGVSLPALKEHFFNVYWYDLVRGRQALIPALTAALKRMDTSITATQLQAYWFAQDSKIDPDAVALMKHLRDAGHRVVLATNQDQSRARYIWDDLNLKTHADAIYASGDLGVAKPDAGFFHHIARAENVAPAEILFLDDRIKNIQAAAALGWQTHHVTVPGDLPEVD